MYIVSLGLKGRGANNKIRGLNNIISTERTARISFLFTQSVLLFQLNEPHLTGPFIARLSHSQSSWYFGHLVDAILADDDALSKVVCVVDEAEFTRRALVLALRELTAWHSLQAWQYFFHSLNLIIIFYIVFIFLYSLTHNCLYFNFENSHIHCFLISNSLISYFSIS